MKHPYSARTDAENEGSSPDYSNMRPSLEIIQGVVDQAISGLPTKLITKIFGWAVDLHIGHYDPHSTTKVGYFCYSYHSDNSIHSIKSLQFACMWPGDNQKPFSCNFELGDPELTQNITEVLRQL